MGGDTTQRRSGNYYPRNSGGGGEGSDGLGARRADAERLAAEEFSAWLVEELGGADG